MADDRSRLLSVFQSFTSFGDKTNLQWMDNAKFFKFAKDLNLLDTKNLTRAEVDMIFTKCKTAGQRRMDFESFLRALDLMAEAKYPNVEFEVAIDQLYEAVMSGGATAERSSSKGDIHERATADDVTSRLTDTKAYTGAHKLRFDEEGHGRGKAGRDTVGKGVGTVSQSYGETRPSAGRTPVASGTSPSGHHLSMEGTVSSFHPEDANKPTSRKADDITSRLTDTHLYTGAHKERFDDGGAGRGRAGRDSVAKGGSGPRDLYEMDRSPNKAATQGLGHHLSMEGTVSSFHPEDMHKPTSRKANDITSRLTDPRGFTGAHKERFDSEGRGRGKEGRADVARTDGYVSGYRNKDTYAK